MNTLLAPISAILTCFACVTWNDAQINSANLPQVTAQLTTDLAGNLATASIATVATATAAPAAAPTFTDPASALTTAATDLMPALSSSGTSAQLPATVQNQPSSSMVLTALGTVITNISQTNAAASYLFIKEAIRVSQCSDAMKLTRAVLSWPDGWGVFPDPTVQRTKGILNCLMTNGTHSVPLVITPTFE